MFSNKETLKELAAEQFVDELAQAIAEQIDKEVQIPAEQLPSTITINPDGIVPYSLLPFSLLPFVDNFYNQLGVGKFSGRLLVCWNGMDNFVFIPDQTNPLTYTTSKGRKIIPKLMQTDGGSIPRILRGFSKKLSPWSYAPAFMVHDWLFAAKKCQYEPDVDWTFHQSADIMAEAMKTLMEVGFTDYKGNVFRLERAENTLYVMHKAVISSIAENLWKDDSSVYCMV